MIDILISIRNLNVKQVCFIVDDALNVLLTIGRNGRIIMCNINVLLINRNPEVET